MIGLFYLLGSIPTGIPADEHLAVNAIMSWMGERRLAVVKFFYIIEGSDGLLLGVKDGDIPIFPLTIVEHLACPAAVVYQEGWRQDGAPKEKIRIFLRCPTLRFFRNDGGIELGAEIL